MSNLVKRFKQGCLLLFILSHPLTGLAQYRFQGSEYREIRNLALEILAQCHPKDCIPIGIGRSPTPLMGFIKELLGYEAAWQLPLSKFNYGFDPSYPSIVKDSEQDRILKQHFNYHFPSKEHLAGKRVLLVDYTATGRGLASTIKYVGQYLRDIGLDDVPVEHLALCNGRSSCREIRKNKTLGITNMMDLGDYPVLSAYIPKETYDQYAQYGSFDLAKVESVDKVSKMAEQSSYGTLMAALKSEINKDEVISAWKKSVEDRLKLSADTKKARGEGPDREDDRESGREILGLMCSDGPEKGSKVVFSKEEVGIFIKENKGVLSALIKNLRDDPGEYSDSWEVLDIYPEIEISFPVSNGAKEERRKITITSYLFNIKALALSKGEVIEANGRVREFLGVPSSAPIVFERIIEGSYHLQE